MRIEAADQLADLPTLMWDRDKWVEFNAALHRLQARLRIAGVPWYLVSDVDIAAKRFWHEVYEAPGPDGETLWFVDDYADLEWMRVNVILGQCLGSSNPVSRFLNLTSYRLARRRWDNEDPAAISDRHYAKSQHGRFARLPGGSRYQPRE